MAVWRFGLVKVCAVLVLAAPVAAQAACTRANASKLNTYDDNTAKIRFDKVNLSDIHLQPAGSRLAVTTVPPQSYQYQNAQANDILWTCDVADVQVGNAYFLIATNGDDRFGGYYNMPGPKPNIYATWFSRIGIWLQVNGRDITRFWQKFDLPPIAEENGKVNIRLQHLPTLVAELYRLENDPPNSAPTNYCGGSETARSATPTGRNYTCNQPSAYIQLAGPAVTVNHDEVGEDSSTHYDFFWALNGLGYGMRNAATLFSRASCVVRNNTPVVNFPPMTVAQLMNGETADQNFFVEIECNQGVNNRTGSGTGNNQVAIGIQVSPASHHHAVVTLTPPLRNNQGGITYLVADNYDQPGVARGVGVSLYKGNTRWNFVAQPGWVGGDNPSGNGAGWYRATQGDVSKVKTEGDYETWQHNFTAKFGRVNNLQVTPGNFTATATVLVKVQ